MVKALTAVILFEAFESVNYTDFLAASLISISLGIVHSDDKSRDSSLSFLSELISISGFGG